MNIYQNIKYISERKKIQQKEIAEALNVGTNTVNNWFQGNTSMKAEQIPLIAKCLRVTVAELFSENQLPDKAYKYNESDIDFVSENTMCSNCYKLKGEIEKWKDKYIYLLENGQPKKENSTASGKMAG